MAGLGFRSAQTPLQVPPEKAVVSAQIIQAGMALGVVLFAGVVYFLGLHQSPESRPAATSAPAGFDLSDTVHLLSVVNAGYFCFACVLAATIGTFPFRLDSVVRKLAAVGEVAPLTLEAKVWQAWSSGLIYRLAFLESSALLGLVVCLMAALDSRKALAPRYWFNAVPAVVFIAYAVWSFPTKGAVLPMIREKVGRLP